MSRKNRISDATVALSGDEVVVRRRARSVTVARILGRETRGASERIYLDRLVHEPGETSLGEFDCEGAVSTILIASEDQSRRAPA